MSDATNDNLTKDGAAVALIARTAAPRTQYHGFVGEAAVGLRDGGLPTPEDALDLGETELYRNPRIRDHHVLRGPALARFFACTGASLKEAVAITYDPKRPLRDWIDLPGDGVVAARTVPLPELAAIPMRLYRKMADGISTCNRLFVDPDGGPTTKDNIRAQFASVGNRIGVDGACVPAALRQAHIGWLDASPDKETAAYLRGYAFSGWTAPPKPSASAMRDLISTYHPLGKLERETLRRPGPVARRDAANPLRALSVDTRKALAAAKRRAKHERYRAGYPKEVKKAVLEGLAAGYEPKTVYAHYGVTSGLLNDYVPKPRPDPLAAHEDAIRALLTGPKPPTSAKLLAWLEAEHRVVVHLHTLHKRLRAWGLTDQLARTPWSVVEPHLEAIRATIPDGGVVDLKATVSMLAWKGVTIGVEGLRHALRDRGFPLPAPMVAVFSPEVEADVRRWVAAIPTPSQETICARLKEAHGLDMTPAMVAARLKPIGGKARAPAANAIGPRMPAIAAYVAAHRTETVPEVMAWAGAELNLVVDEHAFRKHLRQSGIECAATPRVPRAGEIGPHMPAIIAYAIANPTNSADEIRVWIHAAAGLKMTASSLRRQLRRHRIKRVAGRWAQSADTLAC